MILLKQLKAEIIDYPIPIVFLFVGLIFLWFSEEWEIHYKMAGISIMSMAIGMIIGRHDGKKRKIKNLLLKSLKEERRSE